jgi:hypothetical protein
MDLDIGVAHTLGGYRGRMSTEIDLSPPLGSLPAMVWTALPNGHRRADTNLLGMAGTQPWGTADREPTQRPAAGYRGSMGNLAGSSLRQGDKARRVVKCTL